MSNAYKEWLQEREMESAALRGVHAPQPQKPTIESDVLVPLLQGAAIALASSLASGTAVLLFGFGRRGWALWELSGQVAGGAFVFLLCGCVVKFVLDHHRSTRDPYDLARERVEAARGSRARPDPEEDDPPYVIMRPARPALPATVNQVVESIEPAVDPATRRLYEFVIRTWPGGPSISRRKCADLGFSRKTWEKYVGGQRGREGQESGRGLLARAGAVRQGANGWEIVTPLSDALAITDALKAYAESKAALVVGRDGLGLGRDNTDMAQLAQAGRAGEGYHGA